MNVKKVVKELEKRFPNKNIVVNDKPGEQEVICEIVSADVNPERSVALAVVGKNAPTYHKKSIEIYSVIKGELNLNIDNKKYILKKGEKKEIKPGKSHWVEGRNTWFYVYSTPAWTPKDHILV